MRTVSIKVLGFPAVRVLDEKILIRCDYDDPVRIICGYEENEIVRYASGVIREFEDGEDQLTEDEVKGAMQCIYDNFGEKEIEKVCKTLDEYVGLIFSESIIFDRSEEIVSRLQRRGFKVKFVCGKIKSAANPV